MNGSSRTRALVRWLVVVGAMMAVAMGTATALHRAGPDDTHQRLQPLPVSAVAAPAADGGTVDHSAVEHIAPERAEDLPMLSVAAYGA